MTELIPDSTSAPLIRPELAPLLGVLFMMIDEMRSVVIHLTSAHGGEGTSTVAEQVAVAAASTGWCKVALLSFQSPDPGSKITNNALSLMAQFEHGEEPTLKNIQVGGVNIATGHLMISGQTASRVDSIRGLYGLLRSSYTLILVDCPPIFAGQPALLGAASDGVVVVVEAERSRISDILRARETLEQLGANVLGLVLNKQRRRVPWFIRKFI